MPKQYLDQVEQFHKVFNHPIGEAPDFPDAVTAKLRVDLIQEELNELKEAIEEGNLLKVLDAYADLQYVLSGGIITFGLQHVFEEAFQEVHDSNMSKACEDDDVLRLTRQKYNNEGVWDLEVERIEIKDIHHFTKDVFVLKRKDGKVLKSNNYKPARLERFI
jgi:predicted HAD superfamily Cof-like phosphohydrolase